MRGIASEIVTMGAPEVDLSRKLVLCESLKIGTPISDPEVTVIDTRNDYEVNIGTFSNHEPLISANFPTMLNTDPTQT